MLVNAIGLACQLIPIRVCLSSAHVARLRSPTNVADGDFQLSKFRGSKVVTTAVVEMARLVRGAASPAVPGEKVPHAIARAAQRLGWDRGRVASFWYGKARAVTPEELERARDVATRRAKDAELLRDEYRRALGILARLEAGLAAIDADFHSETIAALRDVARPPFGHGNPE